MADYFTSKSVGIETGYKKDFELDRKSLTLATNPVVTDYGNSTFKLIANEGVSQARLAYVSPSLTTNLGGIKLSTSLENKVTYKFNFDGFKTNDVINSARINFGAKYDGTGTALYYSDKWDCSFYTGKCTPKITAGINQAFDSFSLYGEAYLLHDSFKGDFSKASYALGISAKLP